MYKPPDNNTIFIAYAFGAILISVVPYSAYMCIRVFQLLHLESKTKIKNFSLTYDVFDYRSKTVLISSFICIFLFFWLSHPLWLYLIAAVILLLSFIDYKEFKAIYRDYLNNKNN